MSELRYPAPLSIVRSTAACIGLMGVFANGRALINPQAYALSFGFPPGSLTVRDANRNSFIRVLGGRSLASCLALLFCVYCDCNKALAILLNSFAFGGLVDGWTLQQAARTSEADASASEEKEDEQKILQRAAWGHWSFTVVCAAIGTLGMVYC